MRALRGAAIGVAMVCAITGLAVAGPRARSGARAAPGAADAEARRKFEEGQVQYGLLHFGEAARLYAEAYKIRPARVALLLYVADAYQRDWEAGQAIESLYQAIEFFQRYLDLAPEGADQTRARRSLANLRPRLAREKQLAYERRLESAQGAAAIDLVGQLLAERDLQGAESVLARASGEVGHTRAEVAALLRLEAQLAARKGELERALRSWRALLAIEPGFALPARSEPAIADTLAAAQRLAATAGQQPLSARHVPAGAVPRGAPAVVRVEAVDSLGMLEVAALSFRSAGSGAWAEIRHRAASRMELAVPPELMAALGPAGRVEYFVRLLGARDSVLVELGSRETPFSLVLREAERARPARPGAPPADLVAHPPGALRTTGYATLAGGGALLTLGVVTLAWGKSLEGDLDRACPPPDRICGTQPARDDNGRYEALRTLWRVGLVAGGTAAAVGVMLLWLAPRTGEHAGRRLWPLVGWGSVGLGGEF